MHGEMSTRTVALLCVVAVLVGACTSDGNIMGAARTVDTTIPGSTPVSSTATGTLDSTSTSTTSTRPPVVAAGLALVPPGGAPVYEEDRDEPRFTIHEGILLGFDDRVAGFLEVIATCNQTLWVWARDVEVIPKARGAGPPGQADLARATIVVDPGHGDRDWGGVGPTGLAEKEVNLDVAQRLRTLLESSHDVDWESGDVSPGDTVPAAAAVWMTRSPEGPNNGDYELGLAYRSHIANTAGADVFVSIHVNTVPTADPAGPGSEVFYATSVAGSDRLASLIHQELIRGFREFETDWKGGLILGARARVDPGTGTDYYGILRRANMPAVIVEGAYISEPEEEALMRTAEFRDAYAAAVYRGIVRFLTTPDDGEDINDPEVFTSDAGTPNTSACGVPRQP
jgi:N-acetylmuramoyl-L-alanine amidase